jgi:hypothetical protein
MTALEVGLETHTKEQDAESDLGQLDEGITALPLAWQFDDAKQRGPEQDARQDLSHDGGQATTPGGGSEELRGDQNDGKEPVELHGNLLGRAEARESPYPELHVIAHRENPFPPEARALSR